MASTDSIEEIKNGAHSERARAYRVLNRMKYSNREQEYPEYGVGSGNRGQDIENEVRVPVGSKTLAFHISN
jgi:hypothetical protein